MNHQDYENLCAIHAVGGLDGEDLAAMTAHLAECQACTRLVQEYESASSGLGFALPRRAPSAELKERILAKTKAPAVKGRPALVKRDVPEAPKKGGMLGWIAAAAALVLGFVGGMQYGKKDVKGLEEKVASETKATEAAKKEATDAKKAASEAKLLAEARQKDLDRLQAELAAAKMNTKFMSEATVTELKGTEKAAGALAKAFHIGSEIHFIAAGMPALPAGKEYELWVINKELGPDPLPAGMFKVSPEGTIHGTHKFDQGIPAGTVFAVTMETEGGVPKPTMEELKLAPK